MPTALSVFQRRRETSRLILLCLVLPALWSERAQGQQKAFSVKDDIAMARFSELSEEENVSTQECNLYSPDRRYVAVVTTKGLLATDEIQSSISVFDLRDVERFLQSASVPQPRPRVVATVTAIPDGVETIEYAPLIKDVGGRRTATISTFGHRTNAEDIS